MASDQDIANRIPITGALMLATLMSTLDSTIANVALPHMQGSLSASQDQITWVLTSYIIATALMTPLSGWLSQKIGRKRMLLLSIGGFTIASMLCGVATNLPEMVAFRLLQGVAGAALMPLSQTVMLDLYPQRLIPRVMSLWSAAVILGPILGPTLGGWITENLTWRWVFYINLPIGIIATVGLYTVMAKDPGGRQRPFDFLGFGALVAFIGGFQVLMDRGPTQDWFASREIWFETAIAAGGFWVFVVQTATAEHPFFHRDLAKDANFVGTAIFGLFVGVLLFSTTALLPSFMQQLLGYSALQSGIASVPRGVGSLVSFLIVPLVMARLGPRTALIIGLAISIAALGMMGRFDLMMTAQPIMVSGFIQGLGTGLLFAPLTTLAYVTLDPIHRVEGTIVSTMARSLGSSAGISIVQAMVIRTSAAAHSRLADGIDPSNPLIRYALPAFMDPTQATGLLTLNAEVTRQAAMIGYVNVFSWMALALVLLLPLILMLRPTRGLRIERPDVHAD
ncbi:DHA2 family efflux MFS transporter permease subunit [Phenylobacterium sp.]|uniref:DHA2 family efflux MFS transporter permease subunit n=1 Tax=Phenylobacterium sp. TaxID=1871053 RepID=UPI0025E17BA3|nr:DHA2 family efflux MFS transporter permease subunit [Phenylobacterium sp.]